MVDGQQANLAAYGREEVGQFVNDGRAFQAWVQSDGWVIDFMAPSWTSSLKWMSTTGTFRAACGNAPCRPVFGARRDPAGVRVPASRCPDIRPDRPSHGHCALVNQQMC